MRGSVTSPDSGPAPEGAAPDQAEAPDAPPAADAAPPADALPDGPPAAEPAPAEQEAPAAPAAAAAAPASPAGGAPAPTSKRRRGEPRTYDFRRPTKLSREHVRVLQIAQEGFARQATTVLTTLLRAGARLELSSIEQFSYDDYLATLPEQVFIATFTLEPLAGKGLLAYPLDMAMATVDHMLGGAGTAEQPMRPMTAMETAITHHLLGRLLAEFA